MLAAVASALLFDAGVFPKVVVGTFGGIAALASACLYFANQSNSRATGAVQTNVNAEPTTNEGFVTPKTNPGASVVQLTNADLAARWVVVVSKSAKHSGLTHHYHHANLKVLDSAFYGGFVVPTATSESKLILSPNDVATCAIEIIQQLSKKDGDDRWEIQLGPNGLRVSAKKGHADASGSVSVQEAFNFPGHFPTTMVQ